MDCFLQITFLVMLSCYWFHLFSVVCHSYLKFFFIDFCYLCILSITFLKNSLCVTNVSWTQCLSLTFSIFLFLEKSHKHFLIFFTLVILRVVSKQMCHLLISNTWCWTFVETFLSLFQDNMIIFNYHKINSFFVSSKYKRRL